MDPRDSGVYSVHVVSSPSGARLTLVNVDSGKTSLMSTAFAPNTIYYNPSPGYGAFLIVSYPGYKERTIRLKSRQKRIRIVLERKREQKPQNDKTWSFSMGIGSTNSLPDLSYIADESSVADLINEALTSVELPPSKEGNAIAFILDMEYAKAKTYTGKIRIDSTPPGAEIILDENPSGNTPLEILDVQVGTHRISLLKKGYESWTKNITIKEKREKRIMVQMSTSSLRH